jgi:hypothetical protein
MPVGIRYLYLYEQANRTSTDTSTNIREGYKRWHCRPPSTQKPLTKQKSQNSPWRSPSSSRPPSAQALRRRQRRGAPLATTNRGAEEAPCLKALMSRSNHQLRRTGSGSIKDIGRRRSPWTCSPSPFNAGSGDETKPPPKRRPDPPSSTADPRQQPPLSFLSSTPPPPHHAEAPENCCSKSHEPSGSSVAWAGPPPRRRKSQGTIIPATAAAIFAQDDDEEKNLRKNTGGPKLHALPLPHYKPIYSQTADPGSPRLRTPKGGAEARGTNGAAGKRTVAGGRPLSRLFSGTQGKGRGPPDRE